MSMQIQPTIAAGAAAGAVSQSSSKDRASAGAEEPSAQAPSLVVEKVARSEHSSADRDAQGGSYGSSQSPHVKHPHETQPPEHESLPVKPPEPPGLLDIVG